MVETLKKMQEDEDDGYLDSDDDGMWNSLVLKTLMI